MDYDLIAGVIFTALILAAAAWTVWRDVKKHRAREEEEREAEKDPRAYLEQHKMFERK